MATDRMILDRAKQFSSRCAAVDDDGSWTYGDLLVASEAIARDLLGTQTSLAGARVALDVTPSRRWVAGLWGIWRAGGFAVPLATAFPEPELAYVLEDAQVSAIVADRRQSRRLENLAKERNLPILIVEETLDRPSCGLRDLPHLTNGDNALLIYTSGTTGKPKGVVLSHGNLQAQMTSLVQAWEWSCEDRILEFLPLHHVHGIVNITLCALWSGACCHFLPVFDGRRIWQILSQGETTLLMAVPTIYRRLIEIYECASPEEQSGWSTAARRVRLMVSGSAALPITTFERWRDITGHDLLERYGMSEVGMALSNPLHGERRPGTVGQPLPGVELRLVDDQGLPLTTGPGELEIRGPAVFSEYWQRPDATRDAFRDGFFRSGDVAVIEDGYFRLLGRSSVDILKTGGEKVSALEIEEVLREHPAIKDVAVIGLPDPEWGQKVSAAIELREGHTLEVEELRSWSKQRLAAYKVPRQWCKVSALPRNALGKVQKPHVAGLFSEAPSSP